MEDRQQAPRQRRARDLREWSGADIEQLCQHANPRLRACGMEERSRRAALKFLTEADVKAALDEAEAKAAAEYGPAIAKMQRSLKRHVAPRMLKQLASRADRFCRLANDPHAPPGFREAREVLKRYLRQEMTAEALAEWMNGQLTPVTWLVIAGDDGLTIDDGGAMDGCHYLAQLLREGVVLKRFRVCHGCEDLFYDASSRGDMHYCQKLPCRRARARVNQRARRAR
jgi:hypothetical protein